MKHLTITITILSMGLSTGCHRSAPPHTSECAQIFNAGTLLRMGNAKLQVGLQAGESNDIKNAIDCLERALRLTPENYTAQLNLGIAHLANARRFDRSSREHLDAKDDARRMLGRAYMVRQGAYEPLYYLAVLALFEDHLELAQKFAEALKKLELKDGPVNMLLGRVAERQDRKTDALQYYRRAVYIGWPKSAARYASYRIEKLTSGRMQR